MAGGKELWLQNPHHQYEGILTCHHQVNGAGQLLALDAQTALDLAVVAGLDPLDAHAALSGVQAGAVVGESGRLAPFGGQVEDALLAWDLDAAVVDGTAISAEQLGAIALVEERCVGFHVHLGPGERICKIDKRRLR